MALNHGISAQLVNATLIDRNQEAAIVIEHARHSFMYANNV